ncbi:hypothetical protein DFP72DRAFT_805918 [Ephemerocybe angulata]|uniref:Mediator of RNA polymerase II transcription subunit 19 n=1 Tax=Ephemerocybe angulata TaxID=980116 RepID=A0A8H6I6S4_9AGAR|nr:hypothetical protein DFP72DRAFT_805918 [Tulosesus angulatus]
MPSPPPGHGGFTGTASETGVPGSSSSPPHHPAPSAPLGFFLPPPAPPPPKQYLASTQDLLARFHLLSAYDRYVRPSVLPGNDATSGVGAGTLLAGGDKGKGKEVEMDGGDGGHTGSEVLPRAGDGEEEEGPGVKGEKKMKNSYKHLIKGLPGKHPMKKDDYLTNIMLVPPKQRMRINYFDAHTQEEAFAVSPEGLKQWNPSALVLESAQAKEDRRKRKELKRLAKLHQNQPLQGVDQSSHPGVPLQAPAPATAQSTSFKPQGTGTPLRNPSTPRSAAVSGGTPRPGSTIPRPGSTAPKVGTPAATPVQSIPPPNATKAPVPRPGSTVPRPGASNAAGLPPRPASVKPSPIVSSQAVSTPHGEISRGQKRPREEAGQPNPHQTMNGTNGVMNGSGNGYGPPPAGPGLPPKPVLNAKAGSGGVRPRPVKKQRMEGPGQPNGSVQQQPTPQGV